MYKTVKLEIVCEKLAGLIINLSMWSSVRTETSFDNRRQIDDERTGNYYVLLTLSSSVCLSEYKRAKQCDKIHIYRHHLI